MKKTTRLAFLNNTALDTTDDPIRESINQVHKFFYRDYVLDVINTYDIPGKDAEKIVTNAFSHARNQTAIYPKEKTIEKWLEDFITDEIAEYSKCAEHYSNNHEEERLIQNLHEAVNLVINSLMKRGCNYQQAKRKLTEYIIAVHQDDPTISETGKITPEQAERYQRMLDEIIRPKAQVISICAGQKTPEQPDIK